MYAVGGFHNDFFMLVPSTAAIAFLLARRDRSAGAMLTLAVGVKFTAILLLPFLLIAARPPQRRLRILLGAALAAIPLVTVHLALFGITVPNLQDQSTLLTDFSVPNVLGDLLGFGGGTPMLLRVANLAVVATVLYGLRRKDHDWIAGAGWSTFALVLSLAWLVPWYVIWVLPLAALGGERAAAPGGDRADAVPRARVHPGRRHSSSPTTGSTQWAARPARPPRRFRRSSPAERGASGGARQCVRIA